MWIRAILVAVLVCLLILHLLKLLRTNKKYPPGPPLYITAAKFIKAGFQVHPDMLAELAKDYGNIYTLSTISVPLVILSGFQAIKEGLIEHSEVFSGRPVTPFYKAVAHEKGIVFSNGHTWKQQRKFGISIMRKLGMGKKGVQSQIEDEAHELVETFARAKGQPLDPSLPIINSVCNVICALVFGHRYSVDDEEFLKLIHSIECSVKFGGTFFHLMYEAVPWLMKHIKWPYKEAFAAVDVVLSHARKETEAHRAQLAVHDPRDFIDYYLLQMEKSKNDPTSTYDDTNLFQCISDLFVAGTDTTSATLQWGLLLMVTHPDIQGEYEFRNVDKYHSILSSLLKSSYRGWLIYQHKLEVCEELVGG
ncbi:PREDICTED: cytochrome P450 2C14-like [Gekko japonicus]|uniref:Cytochrome P450 2C14-like n=1 Tax=Gekko japonicus TaxID=146911 RepID=A0ABM1LAF3_GEKJA|nr:PREDICTED: cytochrome P450 2C14-like [Gekko japonicus]